MQSEHATNEAAQMRRMLAAKDEELATACAGVWAVGACAWVWGHVGVVGLMVGGVCSLHHAQSVIAHPLSLAALLPPLKSASILLIQMAGLSPPHRSVRHSAAAWLHWRGRGSSRAPPYWVLGSSSSGSWLLVTGTRCWRSTGSDAAAE